MADRFPLIVDSSAQQLQELAVGDNLNLASSGLINADNIQTSGLSVGVMTATSFSGDGSQLTNLPAAGSSTELTASGTLADGSKVIVNADGTVSVVGMSETTGAGAETPTLIASTGVDNTASVYDSTNQKVIIVYEDTGNGSAGTAVVGTVSGTSISFGTPVVFNSAHTNYPSIAYDSTNNKVVVAYSDQGNSGHGTAKVGTVSGTSISFGSATVFKSYSTGYVSPTYDSTNNKVVIAYDASGGKAIVGTVSGTSISFGTEVQFNSNQSIYIASTYDSTNNKVVIAYRDTGNSNYGTAIIGTVSGTSISFGSSAVFESAQANYMSATYDSSNQKVIIAYQDGGNSDYGTAVVGTVSGTSISFGSPVIFNSGSTMEVSATYDSSNQKVVIAYRDGGNSGYGTAIVGTVSGTSISFGSEVVFESANSWYMSTAYDSTNQKVVIAYGDGGNSYYATAAVFSTTGFSIPQLGSPAVYNAGSSPNGFATYDSANQKVVIAYTDNAGSGEGTAVVGTVSGTSISFGTPVQFESAATSHISATFDSTNNKVVIAYKGASNYGKAIVGTVSGTSISFGSASIFRYQNTERISAVYDSSNEKVVVAYKDGGNSDYGTALVGTVSGTSISFGSVAIFEAADIEHVSAVYDSANNKVVIAYEDNGNNQYGTAIVGTVSGTSISFGSPTVFETSAIYNLKATYDSTNGKAVITYTGPSDYGYAAVGTVSGTSISFGTPVAYSSVTTSFSAATFDSASGKVVIIYSDGGNSQYGTSVVGTVSGTSISFGAPIVVESAATYHTAITFDSNNEKVVMAYADAGSSYHGTSVVFSPITKATNLTSENYIGISDGAYSNGQTATVQLIGSVDDAQSSLTPGQKYYVQGNGTLSTTADSPSVLAGTAIAATKLLIKK